ncbi:HYR-like domain-containing protein, partial [Confluentibacter flavum]
VVPANAGSTVECIADAVQPAAPVVTDACGTEIVPVVTENTDPTCEGDKIYTFTYTDCAGNESVYTYTYKIQDTIAPEAPSAPLDMTYECIEDVPVAGNLTAVDNCVGDITVAGVDTIDNSDPCMVIITRTWSFTDTCNNTSTVTQTITVQDTKAPTVAPYDNVLNVSCTDIPNAPSLEFEDNCSSNVTVEFSETSTYDENAFQDYQIVRTWEVTDECGNTDEFTQTINVTLDEIVTQLTAEDRCYKDGIIDLDTYISSTGGTWEMIQGNPDATLTDNIFDPTNLQLTPEFLPTTDGIEYIFRHTAIVDGCINVTELSIIIDAKCDVLPCGAEDIVISKAVTPNGDVHNETFDIIFDSTCGFKANVKIFNRWGALIYESSDYRIGKNMGGFAGRAQSSVGSANQVPNGTYYYIIVLENSGLKPFTGPLYLGTK